MNKILRLSLIVLLAMVTNVAFADVYSYTFESKVFGAAGEQTLGDVKWTLVTDAGYFGFDTQNGKGQQIGSGNAAAKSIVLSTGGISGTITSVKVNTSGASSIAATLDVTVGGKSFGNQYTLTKSAADAEFTGSASGEIKLSYTNSSKKAIYIKSIEVTYTLSGVIVTPPAITPATGSYYEAQNVTISQEDGKDIYYTTDGSDPTSSTTANKYTATFSVSETTTVKAAAKDGDKWSSVVTSTISIAKTYNSFKELQENVTTTSQPAVINFKNAIVTAVNKSGNNAYVVDEDGYGALIYADNHGFEAGDKITGKATGAFVLYTGKTEITGITFASEGLTITKGNTVPVTEVAIDELSLKEQSSVVKISGLTLDESTTEKAIYLTDGINKIQVYGSFMTLPTFKENMTYTVTGVVVWFNTTLEIAPRSEADIVSVPTAISNIKAEAINENAPIYNLAGQRVNKTAKGILIQNGKKFVNK